MRYLFFFFNDTATTEIYTLSLHDALPICTPRREVLILVEWDSKEAFESYCNDPQLADLHPHRVKGTSEYLWHLFDKLEDLRDRKSTRLNSSHLGISYAVFCLKKKQSTGAY